jgi:hypothetical protein
MTLAKILKKYRQETGLTCENIAKKLALPRELVQYLENPKDMEPQAIDWVRKALGITPEALKGEGPPKPPKTEMLKKVPSLLPEKPKEPSPDEIIQAIIKTSKLPNLREFILNPDCCKSREKAVELIKRQEYSLAERNIVLYCATIALYHFCDYNNSSFAFDQYLFKLHTVLLEKFGQGLTKEGLTAEMKEELLTNAKLNVFACDTIENIAILVLEDFARELEDKLQKKKFDFERDLDMPFVWAVDDALMQVEITDVKGTLKHRIKLLDVKPK